jgi:predicted MFS family arabinose efflux permease
VTKTPKDINSDKALQMQSFYLFCSSTFLFGVTMATMNQFRFAAIESVNENLSVTATSTVLIGGLVSAFLGPELAILGKDWFNTPFVGSFFLLSSCFLFAFLLLWFYQPKPTPKSTQKQSGRSLKTIARQSVFIVAMSSSAVGYVVMSYIMTATPVSMHIIDGLSLMQTKFVIQSHVIAMFLPSLFAPIIVKLFGLSKMMIIGVVLYLACIIIGYSHNLSNYWVALVLLGLGWNFLFIGGTSLLPRAYHDSEKFKVQSINDFLIFGMQAIASLEIKWSDLVVKDARKLKSFIAYIKQNKISNNTVTTKTISQERIIDDTLIEFLPSALYAYRLGKNILEYL